MRKGILSEVRSEKFSEQYTYGAKSKALGIIAPGAWIGKEIEKHTADDESDYKDKKIRGAVKGLFSPITSSALMYKLGDKERSLEDKRDLRKKFRVARTIEALTTPFKPDAVNIVGGIGSRTVGYASTKNPIGRRKF